jgi:hypothetical protein
MLVDPPATGVKIHEAGGQHRHTLPNQLADTPLADIQPARQFGLGNFHHDFLLFSGLS